MKVEVLPATAFPDTARNFITASEIKEKTIKKILCFLVIVIILSFLFFPKKKKFFLNREFLFCKFFYFKNFPMTGRDESSSLLKTLNTIISTKYTKAAITIEITVESAIPAKGDRSA